MATYSLRAAPLPSTFRGSPQEFFDAIVERLEVVSDSADFVISDIMPASNQGPWLKGGSQWWVWNEDQSTYVPLDVSASANVQEVWVGENPPDTTADDFPHIWLKTSGVTVIGIYYFFGDPTGWVTVQPELQPNSITTEMLQDGCVSTVKIRDEAITVDKMANNLPFTKFVKGLAYQFLRMDENGAFAGWHDFMRESELIDPPNPASTRNAITVPHDLNAIPSIIRVVLVCTDDDSGFDADDEIDLMFGGNVTPGSIGFYKATASSVVLYFKGHVRLFQPTGSWVAFTPDPSKWKLKVYYAI